MTNKIQIITFNQYFMKNLERVYKMSFASVYPHYVTKVEKKGRTLEELHTVIFWLTGYNEKI